MRYHDDLPPPLAIEIQSKLKPTQGLRCKVKTSEEKRKEKRVCLDDEKIGRIGFLTRLNHQNYAVGR